MSIYKDKDFESFKENIDSVLEKVEEKKLQLFEPTGTEIQQINELIMKFIKENKRKIYGGLAMHMLIKEKKPEDKDIIYPGNKDKLADIDFYSPEPIQDLIKLVNIIHDKGFKNVVGQEGQHSETYKIFVNFAPFCDISYVPRNIYNRMPFKEINGINCIHPHFMSIDYFRMLSDPLVSYWRIDKGFKRFIKLLKYYPLPTSDRSINIQIPKSQETQLNKLLNTIQDFITNKDSLVAVGFYAYNHFLNGSKLLESKKNINKKIIDVPYYEIISTNYRLDALDLISKLKTTNPELEKDIFVEEHYPFFTYFGFHAYIFYKDTLICIIYSNNKMCVPYKSVPALKFNNKIEESKGNILIGSYSINMYYTLINITKARVDGDDNTKNLYYTLLSHLIDMKEYFYEKNKKLNIFNESLFQDFVVDCKGITMPPDREKRLEIERKKKLGKPYNYKYEPSTGIKEPETTYRFANSSGNPIINEKNLKLVTDYNEDNDYNEEEEKTEK
jgi:hypothetical protein